MEYVDLHIHTTASDGLYSPEKLVKTALEKGLKAIAVTDHDSIANVKTTMEIGEKQGLEVIPGIEISVDDKEFGFKEIHILGLFIDVENKEFVDFINILSESRLKQKIAIIHRLQELGYSVTPEEVRDFAKGELGRPHIAMVLMKNHPGEFPDMGSVFSKLLGSGQEAYIGRIDKIGLRETIDSIKKVGGIPILSHPAVYSDVDIDKLIEKFIELGGRGIEIYYPYDKLKVHKGISKEELMKIFERYKKICQENNLFESGGTDCHGTGIVELGDVKIPYSVLEKMKDSLKD